MKQNAKKKVVKDFACFGDLSIFSWREFGIHQKCFITLFVIYCYTLCYILLPYIAGWKDPFKFLPAKFFFAENLHASFNFKFIHKISSMRLKFFSMALLKTFFPIFLIYLRFSENFTLSAEHFAFNTALLLCENGKNLSIKKFVLRKDIEC